MRKILIMCIFLTILTGCFPVFNWQGSDENKTGEGKSMLKDIAYRNKTQDSDSYTVYIQEKGAFEPFLVLSSDYEGGILLLRKFLLEDLISYSDSKSYGSKGGYYPKSNIDYYLNNNYILQFSQTLQNKILDTNVSVSTLESVDGGGSVKDTEKIQRKIFILSASEMNIKSGMANNEGKPLAYYKDNEDLKATYKNGVAEAYWLRTAYLWDDIQAWTVGADGVIGGSSVSEAYAIRPAFCLPKDTLIRKTELNGKTVYVVE
ncbi:DUF6273 domain-containing protein [Acetivibrio straminisolvens]|jgi:hypothetical protein|uniref:DUF6273 domain-containing protein n=2 Tax=Acetivibrio straminisolvens TaxID=253314 RepID=UPI00223F3360|nr:DUF6273 domain-containing protein [Acetivibrio straminisolvens]